MKAHSAALVFVLIDGFSHTYVSPSVTPTISGLTTSGADIRIDNEFAYRGIETSLLTGLPLSKHGVWLEYCARESYLERPGPALIPPVLRILDAIEPHAEDHIRLMLRQVLSYLIPSRVTFSTPNLIPFELYPYFREASAGHGTDYRGNKLPTLFDSAVAAGVSWLSFEPPTHTVEEDILAKVKARLIRGERPGLFYIKFSSLDRLGHSEGPASERLQARITEVDLIVQELLSVVGESYDRMQTVLVSDHGMSEVGEYVDVAPMLSRLHAKVHRDFVPFLDSTTARFWVTNRHTQSELREVLEADGHFTEVKPIDGTDAEHDQWQRAYGDLVFTVQEGVVIHPDFFRSSSRPKGMHGYRQTRTDRPVLILHPRPEVAVPLTVRFEDVKELTERTVGWRGVT